MNAFWVTGDTRDVTAHIPDGTIDLIVTSPPFLALRSYLPADHPDKHREIGSEATPAAFVDMLLELTAEWRRVLSPTGSLVVELGDTYSGSGGAGGDYGPAGLRDGQNLYDGSSSRTRVTRRESQYGTDTGPQRRTITDAWPLDKSLCLIPELYRIALVYGINPLTGQPSPAGRFRARNVIRWVRPNPPVGALGDKFRPATSDLIVACTAKDRWFDLDAVRAINSPERMDEKAMHSPKHLENPNPNTGWAQSGHGAGVWNPAGAPPLDWWQIVPGGFNGAHYAVFPPELCIKPIEAMCPRRVCRTCGAPSRRLTKGDEEAKAYNLGRREGRKTYVGRAPNTSRADGGAALFHAVEYTTTGWSTCGCPGTDGLLLDGYHTGTGWRPGRVLDPFGGSGTVAAVASGHGRDSIGIDIDERNADLAAERVGMFLEQTTADQLAVILSPQPVEEVA